MGLLVALFSLPSCLKNGDYFVDFASAGASVDLPLAATNGNGVVAYTYNATVTSATIPVYVNLASPAKLGTATSVTVAIDTAGLNAYNTANGTSFEVLPDSVYTITGSLDLSIPANQRLDSFQVNLDLTKLDLVRMLIFFPIQLHRLQCPLNNGTICCYIYLSRMPMMEIIRLPAHSVMFCAGAGFTANYPMNINLVTSGPNSVDVFNTDLGLVGYEFLNGGTRYLLWIIWCEDVY